MGRKATKAADNVWYKARIEAAKWNDRLNSRSGAAEAINMSEDAIKDTELGIEKCMSVEKAVLLADLYNAPELLNHYCMYECPIGCDKDLEEDVPTIDRATVKLLSSIKEKDINTIMDLMLKIASDGEVSPDEIVDLKNIADYLSNVAKAINGLQLFIKKNGGE